MKPQRVLPASCGLAHRPRSPYTLAREQRRRCGLLGRALAGALAACGLAALDADLGGEARARDRARRLHLDVARQIETLALRPFLQRRLGVGHLWPAIANRPPQCVRTTSRALS